MTGLREREHIWTALGKVWLWKSWIVQILNEYRYKDNKTCEHFISKVVALLRYCRKCRPIMSRIVYNWNTQSERRYCQ